MKRVLRVLHLSDLHLFGDRKTKMVNINPLQSLQQVVTNILAESQQKGPDLIVLTGDISQDFSVESYKIAAEILQQFSCPIAATMGNHDFLSSFIKTFGNPTQVVTKISDITKWRIIILNSHWPERVEGQLTDSDLYFLQTNLDINPEQPVIIFLHHQTLPVASNWLDKINLKNGQQFLEIISRHKSVKAVICGHVHQDTTNFYNNIMFLSSPSTSWQFALKSNNFKLDTVMPGYRWLNLYEDGTIQTEVVRIEYNEAFIPDTSSKGY